MGVWRTLPGGRKIYIEDGEDLSHAISRQLSSKDKKSDKKHMEYKTITDGLKKLDSEDYEDGSYDLSTMERKELSQGFQASFTQTGVKLGEDQYNKNVELFLKHSIDNVVYGGKYKGTPEASFCIKTKEKALELARQFNQESIWDNENCMQIDNPYYEKGKGNDI